MKKFILLLESLVISSLFVHAQINYNYSTDFTATCNSNELQSLSQSSANVFLRNDSIIIEDEIYNQCCPGFVLKISDIVNDTVFVTFTDTATLVCDCMCNYDVEINAGKVPQDNFTVYYMGNSWVLSGYDSIMVENKQWNVLSGGYAVKMVEVGYATSFLKLATDPVLSSSGVKQLLESTDSMLTWTKIGYIIEEDKQVFFRDTNSKRGLIYDFGAAIGDLVQVVNYAQSTEPDTIIVKVENIDTISYSGIMRQRFEVVDTLSETTDYWISGIGSVDGLLNSFLLLDGGFRELLCVYDDGSQIYENSLRMTCYMDESDLLPQAGFSYDILESYPIQIVLESTASNADSIVWKGVSKNTLTDTIFGTGDYYTLVNPYVLEFKPYECLVEPCDGYMNITQVAINDNGKDSITVAVPVEYYSSGNAESSYLISCFPNPSTGEVQISCKNASVEDLRFIIFNELGQRVESGVISYTGSVINLESGLYVIHIFSDNKLVSREKLIVIE